MEVNLNLDRKMRIIGKNYLGLETYFDTNNSSGGDDSASSPMEIMLEAMGACSVMDVIAIIKKKKKEVINIEVKINGERAEHHPKVFKKVTLHYRLTSPDAELKDLERAVELSQTTYCSASAMFQLSGCEVVTECEVVKE